MDERISVVIPTYNSANFIERTLDSVLSQSVLPYEIIIVDDGSTDKTIDVISDYKEKRGNTFENIKIFQQKNMGAGAARNKCIKEAKGNWIAFLDSDDIWLPEKIEAVREVMNEYPEAAIIAHDEYAVDENDMESRHLCNLHERYDDDQDLFVQLYKGNLFSTSCMVIRKALIEKAGGFDETLRSAQDYDLWIRCGMYGKLRYIPKPYEIYVVRKDNITSNTYRRYQCEMKICRKYIEEMRKRLGTKKTGLVVKKRIFDIHKIETYLSLKQKKIWVAWKILIRLLPEMAKGV